MNKYKQQVIDFFDSRTTYDTEGEKQPREAKRLLESVAVESGQSILDIACGTGLLAIPSAQKVAPAGSVIGVDFSSGMLAQAKEKMIAIGVDNLELIEADIDSVEFASEQFDLIFCCSAIVYLVDIPQIINKCYKWLKFGGCLAFTTPYKTAYMAELQVQLCRDLLNIDLPHITRPLWTPEKCRWQVQQSGFKAIEIEIDRTKRLRPLTDYYTTAWQGQGFFPRGNPLLNLTKAQQELLLVEYQKAISDRFTKDGVWQDSTTLYVQAHK
jgi:arsenite methyltransferase